MSLEIKVGYRYLTRSGDVVEIIETTDHVNYPFRGVVVEKNSEYLELGDREIFTATGLWITGERTAADLIEEVRSYDEHGLTADDYYTGISYPNG